LFVFIMVGPSNSEDLISSLDLEVVPYLERLFQMLKMLLLLSLEKNPIEALPPLLLVLKVGHTIDRCFDLIGYPPGYNKNHVSKSNGFKTFNANSVSTSSENGKYGKLGHPSNQAIDVLQSEFNFTKDSHVSPCDICPNDCERDSYAPNDEGNVYPYTRSLQTSDGSEDNIANFMGDNIPSKGTVPSSSSSSSGLNTQDLLDNGSQVLPAARRSSRPSKMPPKFNDYLVGRNVKYGPEKYVSYANLNTSNYCLSTNLNTSFEPNTYYEAVKNTKWIEAMNNEIEALNRNDTETVYDLPKGRKHVGSKWLFKIKYKSTCNLPWEISDDSLDDLDGMMEENNDAPSNPNVNVEEPSNVCSGKTKNRVLQLRFKAVGIIIRFYRRNERGLVRAGGRRTLKLKRKSSNKADGSLLTRVAADNGECSSRRRLRSHAVSATTLATPRFGSRDLWSLCEEYGKVVDVFIPNRKSKAGKRFAFVRFIRVDDMDWLIGNLCTLWVGRLHLQANAVRYERPLKSPPSVKLPSVKSYALFTSSPSGSFADAVKDIKNVPPHSSLVSCSPALVLDDTCVNVLDVSGQVMGRTKDVNPIPNLRTILTNEGFMDVKLSYLGGLWVMIKLNSEETKMKLLQHTEYKDPGYLSEDESCLDGNNNLGNSQQGNVNQVEESDVKEVSDTIFEVCPQAPRVDVHEVNEKANSHHSDDPFVNEKANSHHSDDPFGLYDLLRKPTNLSASKEDLSLSHPLGFTPVASHHDPIHSNSAHLEVTQDEPPITKGSSSKSYPKASCFSQVSHGNDSSADSSTHVSSRSTPKGGSILEVLYGMIKVGRSMGYDMEGCSKDIEQIIRLQGEADALQETKMESISHMDVKSVWGNSNYQFVVSGSIGNSGGILCVWEETIFKKVDVSISDNFIALYRIWLPTNSKILIVSYAREFNHFISSSGLLEVKMEGYSFTWSQSSASKMSKLDRFLVS
nr:hypothetical protein [Tanacetum cinerariifolium]